MGIHFSEAYLGGDRAVPRGGIFPLGIPQVGLIHTAGGGVIRPPRLLTATQEGYLVGRPYDSASFQALTNDDQMVVRAFAPPKLRSQRCP
jgi:hypothetical protein